MDFPKPSSTLAARHTGKGYPLFRMTQARLFLLGSDRTKGAAKEK
jgi:hypothetical protein